MVSNSWSGNVSEGAPGFCPRCRKPTERPWHICPYCEAVLRGPECGSRGGMMHGALRRSRALTRHPLAVALAVIGGIGLCLVAIVAAEIAGRPYGTLVLMIGLVSPALILIYGIMAHIGLIPRSSRIVIASLLVGALALAGGVLVLSCAAGVLMLLVNEIVR